MRRVFLARSLCVSTNFSRYSDFPAAYLSLGQRKRAAVALAMVGRPEFLVLDEPTAELDGRASRLILLCEGEVLSEGPTANILNNAALLEESGLV